MQTEVCGHRVAIDIPGCWNVARAMKAPVCRSSSPIVDAPHGCDYLWPVNSLQHDKGEIGERRRDAIGQSRGSLSAVSMKMEVCASPRRPRGGREHPVTTISPFLGSKPPRRSATRASGSGRQPPWWRASSSIWQCARVGEGGR
jgi:hypothetical protein